MRLLLVFSLGLCFKLPGLLSAFQLVLKKSTSINYRLGRSKFNEAMLVKAGFSININPKLPSVVVLALNKTSR